MTKISQAFIFAAGRGERMRPLTDTIPKPLVKIKDKAIIDYTIEKLDKISDIKKIIINGFYLADQIENHIKKLSNKKIIFSHELTKVETGGGLVFARDKIDLDEPLLCVNGDILWQENGLISDIEILANKWNAKDCDILLGLVKKEEYFGYDGNPFGGGDFNLKAGNLYRFPEKAMSHAFVGVQIINPKILQNSPQQCFSMSYFYLAAVGETGLLHRIKGVELKGKYFHIGNIASIKNTERML